jgi:hypothetical protein
MAVNPLASAHWIWPAQNAWFSVASLVVTPLVDNHNC